jgi:hypothetical protein
MEISKITDTYFTKEAILPYLLKEMYAGITQSNEEEIGDFFNHRGHRDFFPSSRNIISIMLQSYKKSLCPLWLKIANLPELTLCFNFRELCM